MNVIISNKYQSMLQGLDIETIRTMNGQFSIEEIIDTFKTVFFNRMILDITAIKDYKKIDNLQKLVISFVTTFLKKIFFTFLTILNWTNILRILNISSYTSLDLLTNIK